MFYNDPEVLEAVDAAWRDSQPEDRHEFHEEGGSIFWHSEIGEYSFERCPEGMYNRVDYVLNTDRWPIATYHTHPGLGVWVGAEMDDTGRGPSGKDIDFVLTLDLPMLIRDPWRLYLLELDYNNCGPSRNTRTVLTEIREYPSRHPMPPLWPWAALIWEFDTTCIAM